MPLPVQSLTPESGSRDIREAISQSIKMCMDEGGKTQEQCAAIAYSYAREKTGRQLMEGRIR